MIKAEYLQSVFTGITEVTSSPPGLERWSQSVEFTAAACVNLTGSTHWLTSTLPSCLSFNSSLSPHAVQHAGWAPCTPWSHPEDGEGTLTLPAGTPRSGRVSQPAKPAPQPGLLVLQQLPRPGPSSTSLFSSIKQSLVRVPWERTSFPFQWMTDMEAPAFIMFRLVSEGHMPLFSPVKPWQALNGIWGLYKQEILGFSSWYFCYKKLLSGS